jgi:hypothetical protein
MGETSSSRWPRFSLRTLFAIVTAVCLVLAYHLNWIQQRHELLAVDWAAAVPRVQPREFCKIAPTVNNVP